MFRSDSFILEVDCVPLAREMSALLEPLGGFGGMAVRPRTHRVADETTKAMLYSGSGRPTAYLVCSSPHAPDLVARSVVAAHAARAVLGDDLGRAVLLPFATGVAAGLSYAVFPLGTPTTGQRIIDRVRRRWVAPHVLAWLRRATAASLADVSSADADRSFAAPLEAIAGDAGIDAPWRAAARVARDRLRDDVWRPRHVLEHNDLWVGNVLLGRSFYPLAKPVWGGFAIVDWAGGIPRGHAIYDLLRLAISTHLPTRATSAEVRWHCRTLGCAPVDAWGYLLAALGHLSEHLGAFPRARFVEMAHHCCSTLHAAIDE